MWKPWLSAKRQWKTLSLTASIPSRLRLMAEIGTNRCPESIRSPRQGKRGSSSIVTTRSEEHTSELQSLTNLVCRLLLEKKKKKQKSIHIDKKRKLNYKIIYERQGTYVVKNIEMRGANNCVCEKRDAMPWNNIQ